MLAEGLRHIVRGFSADVVRTPKKPMLGRPSSGTGRVHAGDQRHRGSIHARCLSGLLVSSSVSLWMSHHIC